MKLLGRKAHFQGSHWLLLLPYIREMFVLLLCILRVTSVEETMVFLGDRIVDAINCGGGTHTDVYGVKYRADPLEGKAGISSDHGRRYLMSRIHPDDNALYQTERYGTETFEYEIGIPEDGDYVLVLKFSEVYFDSPNQKVFNVDLNDVHRVVRDLDVFGRVGKAAAHEEIVPFSVEKGNLRVHDEASAFSGTLHIQLVKVFNVDLNDVHLVVRDLDVFGRVGKAAAHEEIVPFSVEKGNLRVHDEASAFSGTLHIQLVKGLLDNPKCNALYVYRGSPDDIVPLPPLTMPEERRRGADAEEDVAELDEPEGAGGGGGEAGARERLASGPKAPDPYADQDHSQMFLPILIAFACFFPMLFCLCKL